MSHVLNFENVLNVFSVPVQMLNSNRKRLYVSRKEILIWKFELQIICFTKQKFANEGKCVAPFADSKIFKTYKRSLSKTKALENKRNSVEPFDIPE